MTADLNMDCANASRKRRKFCGAQRKKNTFENFCCFSGTDKTGFFLWSLNRNKANKKRSDKNFIFT